MLILPISRHWIVSRFASRIYLVCAFLAIAFSGTVLGLRVAILSVGHGGIPEPVASILGLSMLLEILGAALLWTAMLYFWFGFDQSHWLARTFWLVVLCSILPFFWALYYFVIYRRQVDRDAHVKQRA